MSQLFKRRVSRLQTVEDYLRRQSLRTVNGTPCTPANEAFLKDALSLMMWLWADISFREDLIGPRWIDALCRSDVGAVVSLFKVYDTFLCGIIPYASFKQKLEESPPLEWGQIMAPLKENLTTFFKEGRGLKELRSALLFLSHATLPDPTSIEEDLAAWYERCVDRQPVYASDQERAIAHAWAKSLDIQGFLPMHGPGHVADYRGKDKVGKYKAFTYDAMLRYAGLKLDFPPDEVPRASVGPCREGRLVLVPKGIGKRRVISMEPTSLMFYQQGLFHAINRSLFHGPLRRHISLEHPEFNQDLAWVGSMDGSFATIDLSAASDSVSYTLVRSLFDGTLLGRLLVALRSRSVIVEGRSVIPSYYAPMGSALCFPVQCLVFGIIVEAQAQRRHLHSKWRVYGDDIVVEEQIAHDVVERLLELGFEVNNEKTLIANHGFRESCGADWFRGEDVRPLYISRRFKRLRVPVGSTDMTGLVDIANSAYHHTLLRSRLIRELRRGQVLFDDTGYTGVFSPQPTNYHLRSRYNTDLQRWEYWSASPVVRVDRFQDSDGDIRLFEWLRQREQVEAPVGNHPPIMTPSRPALGKPDWRSPAPGWSQPGDVRVPPSES